MYDIAADKPGCTLEPQSYEARIDGWLPPDFMKTHILFG